MCFKLLRTEFRGLTEEKEETLNPHFCISYNFQIKNKNCYKWQFAQSAIWNGFKMILKQSFVCRLCSYWGHAQVWKAALWWLVRVIIALMITFQLTSFLWLYHIVIVISICHCHLISWSVCLSLQGKAYIWQGFN